MPLTMVAKRTKIETAIKTLHCRQKEFEVATEDFAINRDKTALEEVQRAWTGYNLAGREVMYLYKLLSSLMSMKHPSKCG